MGRPSHAGLAAGRDARVVWAAAKVNLFLEVTGKRPDGYHALESLMLAVDLFDTLEVRDDPAGRLTLTCDAPGVPTGPGNLAYDAADRLRTRFAPGRGASIRLTKRIPHQAGLGGGSSDAAAALLACDSVWGLKRSAAELADVAAGLGSDVPFFLGPPAAWCTGRGELIEPEIVGGVLHFVLVKPPVGLGTADVYKRLTLPTTPVDGAAVRAAVRAGDPEAVARSLFNRLEGPAFALEPEVEAVRRRLADCGPLGVLMSGSGSCVFAVCRDRADAALVAGRFRDAAPPGDECAVFVVRSLGVADR
ncbi:MAG: 4-(cytidine 5'-diphospho)-2-C-methyl-D-erythritol kinase [Gemmataceae bacterium]